MKYLLTSLKQKNNTELLLENIVPERTGHIKGYGSGVTFTAKASRWKHNATFSNLKMLQFCDPTVITQ
jgi:hypothetical protein